jgi:predicted transcriptional regulator
VLEIAVNRKSALEVLDDAPHHRRELQDKLDISKATCHRIIRSFDDKGLLVRTDHGYELTEYGRIVYNQVSESEKTISTAQALQPILEGFAESDMEFDLELFTDANVIRAQPDDPYPPIERLIELFRRFDTLRNFGPTPIPSPMAEEVFELLFSERKKLEIIKPYEIISKYVSEYDDHGRKAMENNQLGSRIYDDPPFGLSLFDGHIILRGYDTHTGAVLVSVDTDKPKAVAWGENVYEYYHEQSKSLSDFEEFPEWAQRDHALEI